MYFKNNELGKVCPTSMKPTPLPRTTTDMSASTINTLNRNCHEFVGDEYYQSVASLNTNPSAGNAFLDDDTEELEYVDYSNDPTERLII